MIGAATACSGGNGDSLDNASLGADAGRDAGEEVDAREPDVLAPDAREPDELDAAEPDAECDAGVVPEAVFELATRASDDTLPSDFYNSRNSDITPDGRYVVFQSSELGLVAPPSNGYAQIFLRDRRLGTLELISVNGDGSAGSDASERPAISDDGCLVVFESVATDLLDEPTTGLRAIYVRDRCAATPSTTRVSVDRAGTPFILASRAADIAGDGSAITFDSDHPQGVGDIFLYRPSDGFSVAVTEGRGASRSPAISSDGTRIAFWSYTDNLVASDTNRLWDIFVFDTTALETTLVSAAADGSQQSQGDEGTSTLSAPGISGDGRVVAFRSRGDGLVGEGNGSSQVYVKDTQSGAISVVSVNAAGERGNADSSGSGQGYRPSLSYDGNVVAFFSTATNLVPSLGTQSPSIVIHDRARAETTGYVGFSSDDPPAISGDMSGRYVSAFATGELDPRFAMNGVFVLDREATPVDTCD